MRIGIDIDDTISDTYEATFAYAHNYNINELKKTEAPKIISVKHHHYTREVFGWNDEEEMNFWYKYYKDIVPRIRPYTFAVDLINKLKSEGHKIVIITARWPEENFDVIQSTKDWLKQNNIQYDDIVFDADDKAKVAIEKNIDLFIDDSFKNCTEVENTGIRTFLMDSRTNRGLEAENVTRVYSWPDIYNKINFEK